MTKEELQAIISKQPKKVSFNDGIEWYTEPLIKNPWYKMKDVTNIMEFIPDEAIEEGHLAIKYDNAYNYNRGQTPSVEDYNQLLNNCDMITIEGDGGVLLSKNGKYLYFAEGRYWTSSFEKDNVDRIHPIHIVVSNGEIRCSTGLEYRTLLKIMSIERV